MVDILRKADSLKKSKDGRKNKLNLEEQLLMVLEYSTNVGNRYIICQYEKSIKKIDK
ncbi:DDE transposase family protein [Orientia tsutsugamushi]|uniref:DDE transposase family protein n=1 Tax=Orientia tsutsugamushi TaxID=784 RepID=A0A2U3QTB0_ORITS|nr:putative transposase [Orientia tsutsugamushi str. UT76]KJV91097.1 putative transposase [Orientia tsutsugamushi str. UT76]SPR04190.1 DDE transposase family protein [Orientia tsutsugamushi]